ncbi:sugar diacid recognition domain-containing protein [Niallia sp. Man26]|uniref:CdaR family transcriptional regulator n=1 Tax=Niallia sp. Man26 TaxID=2912824 RepID=UPI001EDC3211|nr:sugar diacid recognition domain-containing protein [Niallia sp. Man26]UPO90778.1 helix-turn-helix domain-containing protein [Niallia sp. Man26]
MKYLNKELAQEIVNRTMTIINWNINVMNEKGVIIASGDEDRVDSIHEGAVKVIETQTGFEIGVTEADKFHGVKAGINLPITFHEKVVGVIGITGAPEEIRNYGELVRMAAEMIIQQAFLMEEMQWDERLKEELVTMLLNGQEDFDSLYFDRARRLGMDLTIPRTVIIMAADDNAKVFKTIRAKLSKDDLYVVHQHYIILLKRIVLKNGVWNQAATRAELERWMSYLEKQEELAVKFSLGTYYSGLEGIRISYQEAVHSLKVGKKLDPDKNIYSSEDRKLPIFLSQAKEQGLDVKFGTYIERLKQQDKKGELLETLLMYVEENGDVNKVAARLFIHRNTLRYRLERINELTGKDPRKIKELVELYLSVLQNQLS